MSYYKSNTYVTKIPIPSRLAGKTQSVLYMTPVFFAVDWTWNSTVIAIHTRLTTCFKNNVYSSVHNIAFRCNVIYCSIYLVFKLTNKCHYINNNFIFLY